MLHFAQRGTNSEYQQCIRNVLAFKQVIVTDDGGDLHSMAHQQKAKGIRGGTEETTSGVKRLVALERASRLMYPYSSQQSAYKIPFDNRHGTGQSTLDGILRATGILLAGKNLVVCGYGWVGKGVATGACFAENGYSGTSLRAIADRAEVSVETVQLNGPKADLMLAAYEQAFAGDEGKTSLLERAWFQQVRSQSDPRGVVRALVDFMVPANVASADLAAAFEAAALSDPRIAETRRGLGERARANTRAGVAVVASLGGVTSDDRLPRWPTNCGSWSGRPII